MSAEKLKEVKIELAVTRASIARIRREQREAAELAESLQALEAAKAELAELLSPPAESELVLASAESAGPWEVLQADIDAQSDE